jgi:hypothetical protein
MAVSFPGGLNTFVPSHEATGGLTIGFSRNPKRFKVLRYVKRVPVKKSVGYYLTITAEEAARIINTNLSEFVWADGEEAPMGNENTESFAYTPYTTIRYSFEFNLGQKAIDQADWKVLQVHAGIKAQQAMTALTQNVWNTAGTTGNWGANTGTATSLGGGLLDNSTTTTLYIKTLIQTVVENILKITLGVVQREDLVMVMNPTTAGKIAKSQEVVDQLKQSVYALPMLQQGEKFSNWGLPPELYGIPVTVEDAVKVTSKKGAATKTTAYVMPAGQIAFFARPGGLMGMEGIPEFSTMQIFSYEEMTVESKTDPDNRRTKGRVVDDNVPALVAPASGYLVTSATS